MAYYEFRTDDVDLHRAIEIVVASDDIEARSLAELRLLLSGEFSTIAVFREGLPRFELHRDRLTQWAVARPLL